LVDLLLAVVQHFSDVLHSGNHLAGQMTIEQIGVMNIAFPDRRHQGTIPIIQRMVFVKGRL
jgi:hypothetical protein